MGLIGFGFGAVFDELEETKVVKLGSNRKRCLCFLFRFEFQVSSDAFTYTNQNSVCACVCIYKRETECNLVDFVSLIF